MTSQLTSLLNQHKDEIAQALLATPAAQRLRAPSDEERHATMLAGLDALAGMIQRPRELRAEMLAEMAQTQMRDGVGREDALALLDSQRDAIYRLIAEAGLPADQADRKSVV